jgi:hypothetical protein
MCSSETSVHIWNTQRYISQEGKNLKCYSHFHVCRQQQYDSYSQSPVTWRYCVTADNAVVRMFRYFTQNSLYSIACFQCVIFPFPYFRTVSALALCDTTTENLISDPYVYNNGVTAATYIQYG